MLGIVFKWLLPTTTGRGVWGQLGGYFCDSQLSVSNVKGTAECSKGWQRWLEGVGERGGLPGADVEAGVSRQAGTGAVGAVARAAHPGCPWALHKHCCHALGSLLGWLHLQKEG